LHLPTLENLPYLVLLVNILDENFKYGIDLVKFRKKIADIA